MTVSFVDAKQLTNGGEFIPGILPIEIMEGCGECNVGGDIFIGLHLFAENNGQNCCVQQMGKESILVSWQANQSQHESWTDVGHRDQVLHGSLYRSKARGFVVFNSANEFFDR